MQAPRVSSYHQLMTAQAQYEVPPFQRSYSWGLANTRSLWDDILHGYRARMDGETPDHFIGAVVLAPKSRSGHFESYSIIDGQQRLLTLTLLMAAIRNQMDVDGSKLIDATYFHLAGGNEVRLHPADKDAKSFRAIVFRSGEPDKRTRLYTNFQFLEAQVKKGFSETDLFADTEDDDEEVADDRIPFQLHVLKDVISHSLQVIVIQLEQDDNAYQIFESLNATGLELTQVDLIRNGLFILLPMTAARVYKEVWLDLEETLGDRVGAFFLDELLRRGQSVSRKEVYATHQSLFRSAGPTEADKEEFLRSELRSARVYASLFTEVGDGYLDRSVPKTVRDHLSFLADWGSPVANPVLLEAALAYESHRIDDDEFKSLVHAIESFFVRRALVGLTASPLRSMFMRVAADVAKADDPISVQHLAKELTARGRWPSDNMIRENGPRTPLYETLGSKQTFLVLRELIYKYEGLERPNIQAGKEPGSWQVEHILPQDHRQWIDDFKSWGCELSDPNSELWLSGIIHRIGNLTLTPYNPRLSNKPYGEKTTLMEAEASLKFHSGDGDDVGFLQQDEWTEQQIAKRSAALLELCITRWPDADALGVVQEEPTG